MTDLRTTQDIGRMPFTEVKFDQALDGSGSFSALTAPSHPGWSDNMADDLMRRVIWPLRAGKPVGAFVFSAMPTADLSAEVRPIRAVPLSALLMRRVIRHTLAFSQVDQNEILRDLMRYALGRGTVNAQVNAALPLEIAGIPWVKLDTTTSGVLRDRMETPGSTDDGYTATGRKVVGSCMANLRELQDGPEFRWLYGLDPSGLPYMLLDTGGPGEGHRVGRTMGLTPPPIVFEFPSQSVAECSYGADGEAMTTTAHVTGQDREGVRPVGMATRTDLLDQGYPLLESVSSESSVQDQGLLDEKATARTSAAAVSLSLKLNGNHPPTFTTYGLGDIAVLRARRADGRRLPDQPIRFTGWSVEVPDSGVDETVSPTVEIP